MKDKFDLIIFDWDGTLVDSIDWIVQCLTLAAVKQGCKRPDEQAVKNIIGLSIQKALETLFPDMEKNDQEQLIVCYRQAFFSKTISEKDLFKGVGDMLLHFKQQGYKLAVATGKGRAGLERAMEGTGLTGFFDVTRCADETASKPHPLMLEEIMQHMDIAKENTVFVGDSIHDLKMAQNAGVSAIAVSCGANSDEQLNQYQSMIKLQHTIQLLDIL